MSFFSMRGVSVSGMFKNKLPAAMIKLRRRFVFPDAFSPMMRLNEGAKWKVLFSKQRKF